MIFLSGCTEKVDSAGNFSEEVKLDERKIDGTMAQDPEPLAATLLCAVDVFESYSSTVEAIGSKVAGRHCYTRSAAGMSGRNNRNNCLLALLPAKFREDETHSYKYYDACAPRSDHCDHVDAYCFSLGASPLVPGAARAACGSGE